MSEKIISSDITAGAKSGKPALTGARAIPQDQAEAPGSRIQRAAPPIARQGIQIFDPYGDLAAGAERRAAKTAGAGPALDGEAVSKAASPDDEAALEGGQRASPIGTPELMQGETANPVPQAAAWGRDQAPPSARPSGETPVPHRPALAAGPAAGALAPTPRLTLPAKAQARAELADVYAGWLGRELALADLTEFLARDTFAAAEVGLPELARALKAQGLTVSIETTRGCRPDMWPALAQMTNGQLILVLKQEGATLTIHDPTQTDRQAEVSLGEFDPYFSGRRLKARLTPVQLTESHAASAKPPHWFWGEFRHHRRTFAEITLGSFVANLLALSIALFSLQIDDRVIPPQFETKLWVLATGAALALVMESLLKMARGRLMVSAGRKIERKLQTRLMDRLLGMKRQPGEPSPSSLFRFMREFGSVRAFFTASTIGVMADLPFILLFLGLIWWIGGNLVFVVVLGAALMVVPGFAMRGKMARLTLENRASGANAARVLHETIFEAETRRTEGGEARTALIWNELTALTALKSAAQRKLAAALTSWAQGVQQATYIATVIIGAYMVFAGELTLGTILAIGILTGRTLAPLSQISAKLARWRAVRSALDGLDSIAKSAQIEEGDRLYLRRSQIEGAWELKNVTFRYDRDASATLDIPALAITAGQKIAVLGPAGAGKSSFLKLLAGLYTPAEGRLLLDGVEMAQISPRDLHRSIGYLGQEVRLVAGTLRDNLTLSQLERDDEQMFQALEFAGLAPFVKGHPKGLDMAIHDGGAGLSVGQRQSIGWARIWLQDPRVVLLDEPTAALGQTVEATVVSRLGHWLKNRTAVIATDRVLLLTLTKRVLILQDGKLTIDGPREAVLAHLMNGKGPRPTAPENDATAG